MTRGRHANTPNLTQRTAEPETLPAERTASAYRCAAPDESPPTSPQRSWFARPAATALQIVATTPSQLLPERAEGLVTRDDAATTRRRTAQREWCAAAEEFSAAMAQARSRDT
jgi:hypothetical protein